MRTLSLLLLLVLATLTLAWSQEDHELFRVRDELNTLEGQDLSFYDFLGVKPGASLEDIEKQNRKRSRQLHPDKAIPALLAKRAAPPPKTPQEKANAKKKPGVTVTKGPSQADRAAVTKEANARYALFSVVVSILRSPQRERYDYFLRHGFPAWRGTGYYFKRYRPGLGTVAVGLLVVFGGAAHYGALVVGHKRQKRFVEKYIERAQSMAWGSSGGIPGLPGMNNAETVPPPPMLQQDADGDAGMAGMPMNRRQKRAQEKEDRKKKDRDSPASGRSTPTRTARSARDRPISRPVEEQPTSGPAGAKKRVTAENGKTLIVDSLGNVYLEEVSEEGEVQELLLDPSELPPPSITQTALFRLPIFVYTRTVGRAVAHFRGTSSGGSEGEDEGMFDDEGVVLVDAAVNGEDANGTLAAASAMNANQEARMRRARASGGKSA